MHDHEVSELENQLDILWDRYLTALDRYTTCRQELHAQLASGYFALAQANARRTSGRRYGRDWYDERTKASARVKIIVEDGAAEVRATALKMSIHEVPVFVECAAPKTEGNKTSANASESVPVQATENPEMSKDNVAASFMLPTPSPSPEPKNARGKAEEIDDGLLTVTKRPQPDPATWYGLFVAPSLRTAQGSFKTAILDQSGQQDVPGVEDSLVKGSEGLLAPTINAARMIRAIEGEIRVARKAIRAASRKIEK